MPAAAFDAVVVGAGMIGIACARELALAGLRVAVCESTDRVAGGATGSATGHLAVMSDSEAQFALTRFGQQLWHELACALPAEAQYLSCGALWLAATEAEWDEAKNKADYYAQRGVAAELLDERQLVEAEPKLRRGLAGALLLSGDAVCLPASAAHWLAEDFQNEGGQLLPGTPVSAVSDTGALTRDGRTIPAGLVIVAAGVATSAVLPECDVRPRKGHLLSTVGAPDFLRHQLLETSYTDSAHARSDDSVALNLQPRATGEIVIGSSRQYGITDPAVEQPVLQRILRRAFEYMPELEHVPVTKTWTGFRPASPDNLPFIGLCPSYKNVYVATGHEGLGISTALATARLLTDDILGRKSAIPRSPYRVARANDVETTHP